MGVCVVIVCHCPMVWACPRANGALRVSSATRIEMTELAAAKRREMCTGTPQSKMKNAYREGHTRRHVHTKAVIVASASPAIRQLSCLFSAGKEINLDHVALNVPSFAHCLQKNSLRLGIIERMVSLRSTGQGRPATTEAQCATQSREEWTQHRHGLVPYDLAAIWISLLPALGLLQRL